MVYPFSTSFSLILLVLDPASTPFTQNHQPKMRATLIGIETAHKKPKLTVDKQSPPSLNGASLGRCRRTRGFEEWRAKYCGHSRNREKNGGNQ